MPEKIDKLFTTAEIEEKSFNDEERSFVAYASRPVPDRDDELIKSDAWDVKNYEKNKVLLWAHDYKALPVGRAMWTTPKKEGLKHFSYSLLKKTLK